MLPCLYISLSCYKMTCSPDIPLWEVVAHWSSQEGKVKLMADSVSLSPFISTELIY